MIKAIEVPMVEASCYLVDWDTPKFDVQRVRDQGHVLFMPVSTYEDEFGIRRAAIYVVDPKSRAPCKLPPARMVLSVYDDPASGIQRVQWQQCPSQFMLRSMVEGSEDKPWLLCLADYDQGKPRVMWFNAIPEPQLRHAS